MVKILHIIPTMNPESGGPAQGVSNLVGYYNEMGVSSVVLTLDDPTTSNWATGVSTDLVQLGPARLSYAYADKLIPWLEANVSQFDAVIVNGLWQYPGFAARRVCCAKGVPYFVFTHGMLDPWFKKAFPLKHLKKWLYWPWGQYPVLRDAAAVLFTCEEERVLARQSFWLYRCNEVVVGYGTAAPAGDSQAQRALFLEAFPAVQGKRNLLFLSRIHEKKGCDLLIEAFASASKSDSSLHLIMAGPDQQGLKKTLIQLSEKLGVADKITWTGMLKGDLKWGAYHAADAFVLTSHQENFGIVVAEALACGLPTLISNKVNIWREIQEYQGGLVDDDTVSGSTKMLEKWAKLDRDTRDVMRKNAKRCFDENFEMGQAALKLVEVIKRRGKNSG